MEEKNKKRDPMPPPDATPEEIGEFWDTHSLADYWDETHEVEFQVNLKSGQDLSPHESSAADQSDTLSAEQGWRKLKELIQSLDEQHKERKKGEPFEELVAKLLELLLEIPFVLAKSGTQPSGDARSITGAVSIQTKNYSDGTEPRDVEIVGDIDIVRRNLKDLQVYVLVISRDISAQSLGELESVSEETGLDIVTLELSSELSDLGALCVTYWEDIHHFFDLSDMDPQFSIWVQIARNDSKTQAQMEKVQGKVEDGIQTQKHVQEDVGKYLRKRFATDKDFNPINLSQAIERKSLESEITDWWETEESPVCCLEGKEGHGKSWLAAKGMTSICKNESIVAFWLDSKNWKDAKSIFDLLRTCFSPIYPSYEQRKITKLQNKPAKMWRKTLIVLDGVNEWNAIDAAQRILGEYFRHESEWKDRIRFLLTIRSLDNYPDFESYLRENCHKISVEPFNDTELQDALTQKDLKPDDLPDSLKDTARIPRYLERCLELRELFDSFDNVTKEMILWADLLYKIKHTDLQVRKKFDWQDIEEAQEDLAKLAQEAKWTNVDEAPQASLEQLVDCFPNYREIRRDLEEQRIAIKAHKRGAKLRADHIVLGWALYLSNLFDSTAFSDIESLFERFRQELEPIPSEDLRTKALFVALQITAISPDPDISQDQFSQKRAALMLAWFHSHNAHITDERLSFWAEKDPDAYAQVVEFEFEYHNSPNYEDALIAPLAKAWLNKKGDLNRLASRLTKWLLATSTDEDPEETIYVGHKGNQFLRKKGDIQTQLSCTAISILSQRPDTQFLEPLARCYGILQSNAESDEDWDRLWQFDKYIGKLMRWGYTEKILEDLYSLAKQSPSDTQLLKGVCRLVDCFRMGLPPNLERALSKEGLEKPTPIEQYAPIFNRFINHIRNQERILTGDSPEANASRGYYGLDYLAVRKDLDPWCDEDQNEIKKISHYISDNPEKGISKDLIPWIAKYAPESYRELSCNLKINALNPEYPRYRLRETQELVFEQIDCEKITEAILGIKKHLSQGEDFYSDVEWFTCLLTEILLFSASEEKLTEWFEFLALHEPLRRSICYEPLPYFLEQLLPKSIVELTRQKLETLGPGTTNDESMSNEGSEKLPEREYWRVLYAFGAQTDEELVTWALKELKLRKPDLTAGTFILMSSVLSDPKRFLDEILNSKEIRKHLFHENSKRSIVPIYEGKDVPSYETLVPLVPPEIVGSFLCSPDRSDDLSRWGRELITRMCSILQGVEEDSNSVEDRRFEVNREVLRIWAEQNTTNFLQLANEYLTQLFKFPRYSQELSHFTDDIRCLLLRFQPDKAKRHYHQWNAESLKTVYRTHYGVLTFLAQLWKVVYCNSPEHRQLRRELLEECLNDEEIMFMTLAALAEGGRDELWSLVKDEYLKSPYAKERNLGVSILPWFGTDAAIEKLEQLKSSDSSQWVRDHAAWAYEVAQQERSCREVYREVLQTRDLFQISAVFEQMKPALSPTAQWWHRKLEKEEFGEEPQDINPKLAALHYRFWYRWGKSTKTKRNIEVFGRKLREYCRGEKLSAGSTPRIAPWWKPTSDFDS